MPQSSWTPRCGNSPGTSRNSVRTCISPRPPMSGFTQDDGHCFVTEDQITSESVAITRLILDIYRDFGFEEVTIKYADRPAKRVGDDAIWDRAEAALQAASAAAGIET